MNISIMFHITLVLMQYVAFSEPTLIERFCQDFIKIGMPLSASCKKSANSTQNLGNCFQSCMIYNGSSYMVSRNVDTTECVCCQGVPSEDVYSFGNWITYSFACPVGYTEVRSHTTRTCLRFVASNVDYFTAESDCKQHNGDLVKLDRPRMIGIFLDFLFNYTTAEQRVDDCIWIQGQEDINGVWRFHDGSQMPGFLQPHMMESNNPGEDRLRYRIPDYKLADRDPTFPHSYICEHRMF